MSATSGHMDIFLRFCVAYIVMCVLFMLSIVSFATPLSTMVEIPCTLMILFYWAIYRPTLLPPVLVFIVGICADIIGGLPLGLNSFILLMVRQLIIDQRVFLTGQPFTVIWLGFSVVSTISLCVEWALFGLINLQWSQFTPVFLTAISGIMFFPIVSIILNLSHKFLPVLPDQYSAMR
ncbi:MAG: hypothetical protein ACRBCK_04450 [Alphaproteobacteria bacterium]